MTIRVALPSDARAIAEVQVAGWHAAYRGLIPDATLDAFTVERRVLSWTQNLTDPCVDRRTTVCERDGAIVGFCTTGACRKEAGVGEVWALYVTPRAWGTGVGWALLGDGLRYARRAGYPSTRLDILVGNARAQCFYERAGFTLEGEPFVEDGLPQRAMRRASRPEDGHEPA